jgi:hypothetical protein
MTRRPDEWELKYCEDCGALFLRVKNSDTQYCVTCRAGRPETGEGIDDLESV